VQTGKMDVNFEVCQNGLGKNVKTSREFSRATGFPKSHYQTVGTYYWCSLHFSVLGNWRVLGFEFKD